MVETVAETGTVSFGHWMSSTHDGAFELHLSDLPLQERRGTPLTRYPTSFTFIIRNVYPRGTDKKGESDRDRERELEIYI